MTALLKFSCMVFLLIGAPLLGMFLKGAPLEPYLAFPPTTEYTKPNSFSWLIMIILFLSMGVVLFPFLRRFINFQASTEKSFDKGNFPSWGWGGLAFLLLSWTLAWTRLPWFGPFQHHTFTPLWIGYILVVNALTAQRTGRCLLTERPFYFLSLFPLSAGFWWFFEFLNRFVQNWYYIGSMGLSPTNYLIAATIPFSTVLPAVVGTTRYLEAIPCIRLPYEHWRSFAIPRGKWIGGISLITAFMGLMGVGLWPNFLYPLLWLSPLFIVIGLQHIWGERSVFDEIRNGNWVPVVLPALAGLCCGFFWEMWNYFSLTQWKYVVPHVHAWQIFEMPLLGYFGYLPFGITCTIFVQFILGQSPSPQFSNPATKKIQLLRPYGRTT